MKKMYDSNQIGTFFDKLSEMGYAFETCADGVLGYGKVVAISPDENHWNYIVKEIATNEWSSLHTVRKCRKISKTIWDEISKFASEQ